MDIISLISKVPGLLDSLKSLGLSDEQVAKIGSELTQQLRSDGDFDLSDLLTSMNVQDFANKIDVGQIAGSVGLGSDKVQEVTDLIAPQVEAFGLDSTGIAAKMGSLASGLFKRD